eukprot:gene7267-14814_t
MNKESSTSIHWFRRGLRIHDNPAFLEACSWSTTVYPVYVLYPTQFTPDSYGINRLAFLLQSLDNLDNNLRRCGTRLYVIKGDPIQQLSLLFTKWKPSLLTFERDPEPYWREVDRTVSTQARQYGVKLSIHSSNTLHSPDKYHAACNGKIPNTYVGFGKLFDGFNAPDEPLPAPDKDSVPSASNEDIIDTQWNVPTLSDLGYPELTVPLAFPGGETEALRRLEMTVTSRPEWVSKFEKPNTSPNSLEPSTTVLSPYLALGCLSPAKLYHELQRIITNNPTVKHSLPPVSLHGQLLWREFFMLNAISNPNFDRMEGNDKCIQIPWERNTELINAWKEGRTGYPFIDAIMTQLRVQGWIHHLARHAVASFLTSLNNANWQWLSASNFFYQYFRIYSPVAFGKKTDPQGEYIKKWIPKLAKYPVKYIYEPWKAPIEVQRQCGCVIGVDYPNRMVEHETVSKINMGKMSAAYTANKARQANNTSNNTLAPTAAVTSNGNDNKRTASTGRTTTASFSNETTKKLRK